MQTCYLTKTSKKSSDIFETTKEQRAMLLRKANILDENGYYVERFFSKETIRKDKAKAKLLLS